MSEVTVNYTYTGGCKMACNDVTYLVQVFLVCLSLHWFYLPLKQLSRELLIISFDSKLTWFSSKW